MLGWPATLQRAPSRALENPAIAIYRFRALKVPPGVTAAGDWKGPARLGKNAGRGRLGSGAGHGEPGALCRAAIRSGYLGSELSLDILHRYREAICGFQLHNRQSTFPPLRQ
jgi:hypothetical protein